MTIDAAKSSEIQTMLSNLDASLEFTAQGEPIAYDAGSQGMEFEKKEMREIKFRCWATRRKKMVDLKAITPLALAKGTLGAVGDGLFIPFREDLHLMQFTGLKDANGVEIYEGDIVYLAGYGNCVMKFPFIELYEAAAENDIGRILGNIHQNPELLEAK